MGVDELKLGIEVVGDCRIPSNLESLDFAFGNVLPLCAKSAGRDESAKRIESGLPRKDYVADHVVEFVVEKIGAEGPPFVFAVNRYAGLETAMLFRIQVLVGFGYIVFDAKWTIEFVERASSKSFDL